MEILSLILLIAILLVVILSLVTLRKPSADLESQQQMQSLLQQATQQIQLQQHLMQLQERAERGLREQIQSSAQATRQELGANFSQLQQTLAAQLTSVATLQNSQLDAFSQQLIKLTRNQYAAIRKDPPESATAGTNGARRTSAKFEAIC